jgi:hypothetical protein
MMRTLRDMNMSKFVAEDVPLFLALLDDLFPGTKAERSHFPKVVAALEKVVEERDLQKHPSWLRKAMELYETYLVRHGIMVVGPAGSGKTQLIECLAAALTELGTRHAIWRMNPKAITVPQIFGRLDAATGGSAGRACVCVCVCVGGVGGGGDEGHTKVAAAATAAGAINGQMLQKPSLQQQQQLPPGHEASAVAAAVVAAAAAEAAAALSSLSCPPSLPGTPPIAVILSCLPCTSDMLSLLPVCRAQATGPTACSRCFGGAPPRPTRTSTPG